MGRHNMAGAVRELRELAASVAFGEPATHRNALFQNGMGHQKTLQRQAQWLHKAVCDVFIRHGTAYRRYADRTGRFVPGLGRLRAAAAG